MKHKTEQEIKILDIFNFPNGQTVVTIDCQIEPMTGYYLADFEGNLIWEIEGVIMNVNRNNKLNPIHYLNNKNYLRNVSLKPVKEVSQLEIGDNYYMKKSPLNSCL